MNGEKVLNLVLNILFIIMILKDSHLLFMVFILIILPLIPTIPITLQILPTIITPTPLTPQMILLLPPLLLLKMIPPIVRLHLAKFNLQFIPHLLQEQYSSQQLLTNLQLNLSFSI